MVLRTGCLFDCADQQMSQKRLVQIRYAAGFRRLLMDGLVVDRGHENDRQLGARLLGQDGYATLTPNLSHSP
jgi:hypothetical protein